MRIATIGAAALVMACGGHSSNTAQPCTITLTGDPGIAGSYSCSGLVIRYDQAASDTSLSLDVVSSGAITSLQMRIGKSGAPGEGGATYNLTTAPEGTGLNLEALDGGEWAATGGSGAVAGDYQVTVVSMGDDVSADAGVLQWSSAHGTLSARLVVPQARLRPGTPASDAGVVAPDILVSGSF